LTPNTVVSEAHVEATCPFDWSRVGTGFFGVKSNEIGLSSATANVRDVVVGSEVRTLGVAVVPETRQFPLENRFKPPPHPLQPLQPYEQEFILPTS
jgi:hypothetical protein